MGSTANRNSLNDRQKQMVRECTSLISDEVARLQRMVDEFSTLRGCRMPKPELAH
jgi:nitrogen fixation/metabolism regulation signal transduction histidine kinase